LQSRTSGTVDALAALQEAVSRRPSWSHFKKGSGFDINQIRIRIRLPLVPGCLSGPWREGIVSQALWLQFTLSHDCQFCIDQVIEFLQNIIAKFEHRFVSTRQHALST
jgi:hypothetical protein